MIPTDPSKFQAATLAVSLVKSDMVVGLGTGSTASIFIELLGRRLTEEGLRIQAVSTSDVSTFQARAAGIPLIDFDDCVEIDLTVDGADEVDGAFRMVKGRGGALLREKLVARASKQAVYIVGRDKLVDRLGTRCPLPVEVAPFGVRHTIERLERRGAKIARRTSRSDGGNALLDCDFGQVADPESLDREIKETPGVFETGFFLVECTGLIVGDDAGAKYMKR